MYSHIFPRFSRLFRSVCTKSSGPKVNTCLVLTTFGVEESKQLSAQLSVGHGLREKFVLLGQLLSCELLRLPRHPLVVVQQRQQSGVGGFGE